MSRGNARRVDGDGNALVVVVEELERACGVYGNLTWMIRTEAEQVDDADPVEGARIVKGGAIRVGDGDSRGDRGAALELERLGDRRLRVAEAHREDDEVGGPLLLGARELLEAAVLPDGNVDGAVLLTGDVSGRVVVRAARCLTALRVLPRAGSRKTCHAETRDAVLSMSLSPSNNFLLIGRESGDVQVHLSKTQGRREGASASPPALSPVLFESLSPRTSSS